MFPRAAAALIPLAGLASAAQAQFTPDSTVSYSLSWRESDANGLPAGNGDGLLEPGEHALLSLTVSFSNQHTIGSFSPPIGTFASGTILGFGSGIIDLVGANGAEGAWNVDENFGLGVHAFWAFSSSGNGTSANGGARLTSVLMYQSSTSILTYNPVIDMWKGVWTPVSYASRTSTFTVTAPSVGSSPYFSTVLIRFGGFFERGYIATDSLPGSVQIPIIPAPATAAVLFLAAAAPRRRRAMP